MSNQSNGISFALKIIKEQTIAAIISILKERKHFNIEFHKPIINQTTVFDDGTIGHIESQSKISVLRLMNDEAFALIQETNFQHSKELKSLSIELLVDILNLIEINGYEF